MKEVPIIYKQVYWFALQSAGFYMIGTSVMEDSTQ